MLHNLRSRFPPTSFIYLLLGLFVCQQDDARTSEWISSKLGGRLGPDLDKGTN